MKNYDESYLAITAAAEIADRMRSSDKSKVVNECNKHGFRFKTMNKDCTKLKAQFLLRSRMSKIEIFNDGNETTVTYELP